MRQISKVVLLVAPVLLASCGCASKPAWISQKTDCQAVEEVASGRTERLLQVAQKYEEGGKTKVAYQLYRHIASQDPQCAEAKSRMTALAPQIESSDVKLASKSSRRRTPQTKQPFAPTAQRQVVEIDWEEAKKQAKLKTISPGVGEKKVNNIELSYAGPSKSTDGHVSESSIIKESPTATWKDPQIAQRESDDLNSAEQIAQPIADFQHPIADNSLANSDLPPTSQAWWDAKLSDQVATSPIESTSQSAEADTIAEPIEEPVISSDEMIASNDGEVPKEVVSAQSLCPAETAEELIQVVALLDCPEPEVRIAGLIELGIKGSEAVSTSPAVRSLLHDQNAMVRAHAAGTVRDIEGNNADSVKNLALLLSEENQGVVRLSCYLLGQMGADASPAVKELKQLRDNESGLTSLHAAEALTRIVPSETKSYSILSNALTCDDSECRVFAAVSLGGVYEEAGPIAVTALIDALESDDPAVRASAALSLGGLGKHAEIAIDQLQQISDSDQSEVRDAALTALACLGK